MAASHPEWIQMPTTEMKPKTALLGGTFNPVHSGHVHLMHEIYAKAGIGNLILIPAYLSNFKRQSHPVSFEERVEMLSLAIEDYKDIYPDDMMDVSISRFEGEKKGISYTSETVKAFFDSYNDNGKINFIIGDDILPTLGTWHDFDYLRSHVRFLCFSRYGMKDTDADAEIIFIRSDVYDASSSEVRAGDFSMLSRRVREYVRDNKLYRT